MSDHLPPMLTKAYAGTRLLSTYVGPLYRMVDADGVAWDCWGVDDIRLAEGDLPEDAWQGPNSKVWMFNQAAK